MMEGTRAEGPCTVINGVDFSTALKPLPDAVALKTDSVANKFAMLIWSMLDACESGSIGGDACRMNYVLTSAAQDTLNFTSVGPRFQHLLGLTLAIFNHGVESWIVRGDPSFGRTLFKVMGDEWKKLLQKPEATLVAAGISLELRGFAIESGCMNLQKYLKSFDSKKWAGTGANVYSFNFMAKPRVKRSDAPTTSTATSKKRARTTE